MAGLRSDCKDVNMKLRVKLCGQVEPLMLAQRAARFDV